MLVMQGGGGSGGGGGECHLTLSLPRFDFKLILLTDDHTVHFFVG